jgi:hypothetical protein
MVEDLVVDEGIIVLDALLGEDALVILEELVMVILHCFYVFEDDCPIVVQMGFELPHIAEVHVFAIIILSYFENRKGLYLREIQNSRGNFCAVERERIDDCRVWK